MNFHEIGNPRILAFGEVPTQSNNRKVTVFIAFSLILIASYTIIKYKNGKEKNRPSENAY